MLEVAAQRGGTPSPPSPRATARAASCPSAARPHMSAQAAVAVLFLDIDGVLNRTHGATHIRLDDDCVARLRTIVQRSRCSIVLSTFWRGFEAYVKYILHRQGIDSSLVIGRTPGTTDGDRFDAESSAFDAQQYANRAAEIRSWLQANPSVTRFVILDDRPSASDEGLAAHFVQTQSDRGLTDADVQAALAILAEVTWTAEDEEPAPDESDVQERTPRQQPSHLLPPMATTRSRPRHVRRIGLSRAALAPHVPGQLCRPRAGPRADATHLPAAARQDVGPLRRRVVYAAASRARITKHPLWAAHALSASPARRRRRVREAGQVRRRAAGLLRLRARRVRGRRRRVRAGRAAAGRAGAPLVAARVRDALGVVGAAAAAHLQLLPGAASRAARASVRSEREQQAVDHRADASVRTVVGCKQLKKSSCATALPSRQVH